MAGTTTVVTGLWGSIVTTSGGGTLLRDVTSLTTGVTLSDTGLTVTGKVVWTTALVTSGLATSSLSSTELLLWSSGSVGVLWLWAGSGDVAKLRTVVTTGALGLLGAVRLDVTDTTTVVALLLGILLWLWTGGGLVAWEVTVVTETLLLGTDLSDVAELTTLVTGSWENSSHLQRQLNNRLMLAKGKREMCLVVYLKSFCL